MKISKNFSHRNLDCMFRIMILIYGEKKNEKKYVSKFMQDNMKDSMIIINLTKNRIWQQVQKIKLKIVLIITDFIRSNN